MSEKRFPCVGKQLKDTDDNNENLTCRIIRAIAWRMERTIPKKKITLKKILSARKYIVSNNV